mmetsp:Transcript_45138/g.141418  ORF Transcript_45138/g.141418 Transcript_45138/m.141418 type:complete len:235 (+) Transcript_45138:398-1102(+)
MASPMLGWDLSRPPACLPRRRRDRLSGSGTSFAMTFSLGQVAPQTMQVRRDRGFSSVHVPHCHSRWRMRRPPLPAPSSSPLLAAERAFTFAVAKGSLTRGRGEVVALGAVSGSRTGSAADDDDDAATGAFSFTGDPLDPFGASAGTGLVAASSILSFVAGSGMAAGSFVSSFVAASGLASVSSVVSVVSMVSRSHSSDSCCCGCVGCVRRRLGLLAPGLASSSASSWGCASGSS